MKTVFVLFALAFSMTASAQLIGKPSHISFTQSWSRYPAPDAIVETLKQQFPNADAAAIGAKCLAVTADNQMLLGQSNPLTGEPAITNPNSAFIVWYTGCLKLFISGEQATFQKNYDAAMQQSKLKVAQSFVGQKLIDLCPLTMTVNDQTQKCAWSVLNKAKRVAALAEEIELLVGPDDVIRDQGIAPSLQELAERIDTQLVTVIDKKPTAFNFLGVVISKSPTEVGTPAGPLHIRPAIQFLILLNDTLKY